MTEPSHVLSLEDAERLAERTLATIPGRDSIYLKASAHPAVRRWDADRERVASDLAGLRECGIPEARSWANERHAQRFSDNLRRTAALYGVAEQ